MGDAFVTTDGQSPSLYVVRIGGTWHQGQRFGMARRLQRCDAATMECRIEVTDQAGSRTVRVAGRLTDAQVPDLLSVCASGEPTCLDLAELDSASSIAVDTLRRLMKGGVQIVGATRFIQMLIDTSPAEPR